MSPIMENYVLTVLTIFYPFRTIDDLKMENSYVKNIY